MNKSSRRWKVFVIVLCMLFTMTPATVFADDSADPLLINQPANNGGNPEDPGTPPDPGKTNPEDPRTPNPGDPGTPPDSATLPAVQMMLTEPMTVKTGTIEITKIINNDPGTDETFTFEIWKEQPGKDQYITNASIQGDGSVTVENLPAGSYIVKEVDIPTNYVVFGYSEKKASITHPNYSGEVTFTNTYTVRRITIEKKIEEGVSGLQDHFTFEIWKEQPGPDKYVTSASIVGEGLVTIEGLPEGKYKVKEVDIPKYYDKDISDEDADISGWNYYDKVTFINEYTSRTITINKLVTGDPESSATFNFEIWRDHQFGPDEFVTSASIVGPGTVIVEGFSKGDYKVKEINIPQYYTTNVPEVEKSLQYKHHNTAEFTNAYNPPPCKPDIEKTVALYTGDNTNIPEGTSFDKTLNLTALNKKVIYKIELTYDSKFNKQTVRLEDLYDGTDITDNLLVLEDGLLTSAAIDEDFPGYLDQNATYYYLDTLKAKGTYTNTAYLYEPELAYKVTSEEGCEQEEYPSSTAIVTVKLPGNNGGGGGGGGGGSTHYYEVTYNANYPSGADMSGEVPTDTKDYTYNTTVSVRGNTGDMKAGTYTFIGWNTKADGTGTMYLPGNTFNIKEDTILYAQWKLVSDPAAATVDPNTGTDVGGTAAAETVQATGLDDVPKTGTGAPLILMFLLGLLSLAGITLGRKKILG